MALKAYPESHDIFSQECSLDQQLDDTMRCYNCNGDSRSRCEPLAAVSTADVYQQWYLESAFFPHTDTVRLLYWIFLSHCVYFRYESRCVNLFSTPLVVYAGDVFGP